MGTRHLQLTIFCALFLLCGCASKNAAHSFLREEVDLGYVQRIAVLPFENNTKEEYAAERTRDLTITQVLSQKIFDVVDKGQTDSVLHEEAIDPGKPIDNLTLKRLGQRLNVQAFLMGSIDHIDASRVGGASFPEISLTFRLIDSKNALLLWQASGHGSGYSTLDRLFGLNPKDTFQVTMDLIDNLLASVPRAAK